MADYGQALQALSRAPLAHFIAERTRLAGELRAAGDEDGAKRLAQRRRPTASAWTVNQLHVHARGAFDALLAAAARMQKGDLAATTAYREALGELRQRAAVVLRDAAHDASSLTMRRVMGTLAAVAAAGGFDPDPPGALATDREPPGFDAVRELPATAHRQPNRSSERARAAAATPLVSERKRLAAVEAKEREEKRKDREAEHHRLRAALRDASAEVRVRERALSRLQHDLRAAEQATEDAREVVRDLERRLAVVDEAD